MITVSVTVSEGGAGGAVVAAAAGVSASDAGVAAGVGLGPQAAIPNASARRMVMSNFPFMGTSVSLKIEADQK